MDILSELFGPGWANEVTGDAVDTTTPSSSTPTPTTRPPSAEKKSNSIKGKGAYSTHAFSVFRFN